MGKEVVVDNDEEEAKEKVKAETGRFTRSTRSLSQHQNTLIVRKHVSAIAQASSPGLPSPYTKGPTRAVLVVPGNQR
jgi:hypothetical protein